MQKSDRPYVSFHIIENQETQFRYEEKLCIFYGIGGTSIIFIGDRRFEISENGILSINPGTMYRVVCIDASLVQLEVSNEVLKMAGDDGKCSYMCYVKDDTEFKPEFQVIREQYATLFYDYIQNNRNVPLSSDGPLPELLHYIFNHFGKSLDSHYHVPKADKMIKAILHYIDLHWNEELTLSVIAKQFHFSVSYLSRFFLKATGMHFSSYLRKVRLIHSRGMLIRDNSSITQIALDCGFNTPSLFIEAFKQEYNITPGRFRQNNLLTAASHDSLNANAEHRRDLSLLLSHIPQNKNENITIRNEKLEIDADKISHKCEWSRILNIGYARDVLQSEVRAQIEKAQREIGFDYFRCHGVLDPDMFIYKENEYGESVYSFAYLDLLLDFITELGLKPFIELSFMPPELAREQTRIFDRPSVISGCKYPEKWKALIKSFMNHLAERYGIQELRSWRFSTISLSYVRVGCLTLDEFAELYEMTWHIVKETDPDIKFGGAGYFPDLTDNEEIGTPWFLNFAVERGCPPDFHSMQWYPCLQTDDSLFLEYTLSQRSSPAILSQDPEYLEKKLNELKILFQQYQLEDRELFLEECNSTLWQRDLTSDTCYKAVWLAKNMVISSGSAVFGYWSLTDFMEERAYIQSVFHGGYGLFTYQGIPKAGYHAMRMMGMLGNNIVSRGSDWIMTSDEKGYCLLVYNYVHYTDSNCYRYSRYDSPEEAYSTFCSGEHIQYLCCVKGLPVGRYIIERHSLNREHGSSFDSWLQLGAPNYLTVQEEKYLKEHSNPDVRLETKSCEGSLTFDISLMPLEMELIRITKSS